MDNDTPNMNRITPQEGEFEPCFFSGVFCAALDNTTIPIYIIDPRTFEVLYCNLSWQKAMGANGTGRFCYQVIRGSSTPCDKCAAMNLYQEGDCTPLEVHDPRGYWFLIHASPLRWQGRDLIQITCVDISKQKQLENELRLRNKEYSAVVRHSTTGIMRYDLISGAATLNVDNCLNRVDEYTLTKEQRIAFMKSMVAKDSQPAARRMFQSMHAGEPSAGYDIQLLPAKGEPRWCHMDYTLIEDEVGVPYRAIVSFSDNTEQLEKELAYQRWSARMDNLVDEHTSCMEINLTQDTIEAVGTLGAWNQGTDGRRFSSFVMENGSGGIDKEDRHTYLYFFDRERLLGQFHAGEREGTLEYRALVDGSAQWFKAELQMVDDPVSGDVKASIVFNNVDSQKREKERLTQEAERDSMTGLYNHATAETLIQQVLSQHTGERCCFLMIDLDDLRDINSTLGHPEGDRALMAIADEMRTQFRKDDILARIGGDEFIVFLRESPSDARLRSVITRFMQGLNKIRIGAQNERAVHVSIGGSIGTVGEVAFRTLYEQADLAMFYTKAMGKNAFHLYEPGMEKREFSYQPRSTATLTELDSIDKGEFKKLLQAVSMYFPMVISVNLTKNTYYMMEYASYAMQKHKDSGNFDQLIDDAVTSFHPEDRESFVASFGRENLLQAYERGERLVRHTGRQMGDDGIYRMTYGTVIFVKDENSDDICEITFSHEAFAKSKLPEPDSKTE